MFRDVIDNYGNQGPNEFLWMLVFASRRSLIPLNEDHRDASIRTFLTTTSTVILLKRLCTKNEGFIHGNTSR